MRILVGEFFLATMLLGPEGPAAKSFSTSFLKLTHNFKKETKFSSIIFCLGNCLSTINNKWTLLLFLPKGPKFPIRSLKMISTGVAYLKVQWMIPWTKMTRAKWVHALKTNLRSRTILTQAMAVLTTALQARTLTRVTGLETCTKKSQLQH